MKGLISFLGLMVMVGLVPMNAYSAEEAGAAAHHPDEELSQSCNHLKEEFQELSKFHYSVSGQFARLSDATLCRAASRQCEDFYSRLVSNQKKFKEMCGNSEASLGEIAKCDYSQNGCAREVSRPSTQARGNVNRFRDIRAATYRPDDRPPPEQVVILNVGSAELQDNY